MSSEDVVTASRVLIDVSFGLRCLVTSAVGKVTDTLCFCKVFICLALLCFACISKAPVGIAAFTLTVRS